MTKYMDSGLAEIAYDSWYNNSGLRDGVDPRVLEDLGYQNPRKMEIDPVKARPVVTNEIREAETDIPTDPDSTLELTPPEKGSEAAEAFEQLLRDGRTVLNAAEK